MAVPSQSNDALPDAYFQHTLRPNVLKLVPYKCARDEFTGIARVFLDANENAYGPCISVEDIPSIQQNTPARPSTNPNADAHAHAGGATADPSVGVLTGDPTGELSPTEPSEFSPTGPASSSCPGSVSSSPPTAMALASAVRTIHRYPHPLQLGLKSLLAAKLDPSSHVPLSPVNFFLGVGSDEAIDLLIRIACRPGRDAIVIAPPTYGMYGVAAGVNDITVLQAPLTPSTFQIDLARVAEIIREGVPPSVDAFGPEGAKAMSPGRVAIVFLCSPNNPTGNDLSIEDIVTVLNGCSGDATPGTDGMSAAAWKRAEDTPVRPWSPGDARPIVVVDEAYVDFAGRTSLAALVAKHRNLVVLQTFSKSYGVAAARLGLAVGDPFLIRCMNSCKAPYNVSSLAEEIGLAAVANGGAMRKAVARLIANRSSLARGLEQVPGVTRVYPSVANFLLVQLRRNARAVYEALTRAQVVVRYRGDQLNLADSLRITVGTAEENEELVRQLMRTCAECGVNE
eukprot:TRINITY_DN56970_c0_g1_i1.p1 TRINITY_DN56970_c0_g1~~TRINITY_DN56970_c0_g1_i1.p1  ORF type:complete len:511 (+),score=93.01 TRINITY_DN56970_c0_g1_i1:99-1631(+)